MMKFDGTKLLQKLQKAIDDHSKKIVSFDIFDTLLVRPCIKPTEVLNLLSCPPRVLQSRLNAESDLCDAFSDIFKIWDHVKQECNLSEVEEKAYLNEELNIERKLLSQRIIVYEIYKYAAEKGKKVIAISDMYLPEKFLTTVLLDNGYLNICNVYVSCNRGARKDNGELFEKVMEAEGVKPSDMIHIGDNFQSDFKIPSKLGIASFWIPSNMELFKKYLIGGSHIKRFDMAVSKCDIYAKFLIGYSINRIYELSIDWKRLNRITFVQFVNLIIAPYVIHTAFYIRNDERIQSGTYDRLFFASRDGFLPMNIYKKIKEEHHIEARYIYASRRAYECLLDKNIISRLDDNTYYANDYTLNDFLMFLLPEKSKYLAVNSKIGDQYLTKSISKNKKLCKSILSANLNVIEEMYEQRRIVTSAYYSKLFKSSNDRILIFDCGYSGSISENLMSMDSVYKIDKVYLWETKLNLERDLKNGTRTFVAVGGEKPAWLDVIIETFFSSYESSCIGFQIVNKDIIPIFEDLSYETKNYTALKSAHDQVYLYLERFISLFGEYTEFFGQEDVTSIAQIADIIFSGRKSNQLIFDGIFFEDSYLHGNSIRTLFDVISELDSEKNFFLRIKKRFKGAFRIK